jgi:hypothetical protein
MANKFANVKETGLSSDDEEPYEELYVQPVNPTISRLNKPAPALLPRTAPPIQPRTGNFSRPPPTNKFTVKANQVPIDYNEPNKTDESIYAQVKGGRRTKRHYKRRRHTRRAAKKKPTTRRNCYNSAGKQRKSKKRK